MLPLVYKGQMYLDECVAETALLDHLASCLKKLDARDIRTSGNSISFRGGLFRGVSGWNILIPFGRGDFTNVAQ
jgi:hypothetical protein